MTNKMQTAGPSLDPGKKITKVVNDATEPATKSSPPAPSSPPPIKSAKALDAPPPVTQTTRPTSAVPPKDAAVSTLPAPSPAATVPPLPAAHLSLLDRLKAMTDPGPGTGSRGRGPAYPREDLATIAAFHLLLRALDSDPITVAELLVVTGLKQGEGRPGPYTHGNSLGDALGRFRDALTLDRVAPTNAIPITEENLRRCFGWLDTHRIASANVAKYCGLPEGADIFEAACAKLAVVSTAAAAPAASVSGKTEEEGVGNGA